jgi:(2Fe-2S) ferredoxin
MPLRKQLVKLLHNDPEVRLVGYACFGQCDFGPNVAFYPEAAWYGGLSNSGDAERVVNYARRQAGMDRPPLQLPPAEREEHLRNIDELVRTLERDRRSRPRRWWWPFG